MSSNTINYNEQGRAKLLMDGNLEIKDKNGNFVDIAEKVSSIENTLEKVNVETVEPINWLNYNELKEGYRISNSGQEIEDSARTVTGYIPVNYGDTLTLYRKALTTEELENYAIYDNSKQVITYGGRTSTVSIDDPSAKYFRFSMQSKYFTSGKVLVKNDRNPASGERYFDPYETVKIINRIDNADTYNHLPRIDFYGDTTGMTKEVRKTLAFRYIGAADYAYYSKESSREFSGYAKVKWQGSSSVIYPKKNYSINLFKDEACNEKYNIEFQTGWGEHNKYVLKANFIDITHARNIISAKLWGQMVKSRNTSSLSYSRLNDFANGGAIDGYPIRVYFNGEYKGLYTFNLPKDGYTFGMTGASTECLLSAEKGSSGTRFQSAALIDGTDFDYEVEPPDKSWVLNSFNAIYNALQITDATQKKTALETCLDIYSIIDHMIFTTLLTANDNREKNFLMGTFDGTKWFLSQYDMDTTYGIQWHGCSYYSHKDSTNNYKYGALCTAVFNLYKTEFKNRYTYIRENIINTGNLQYLLSGFLIDVPIKLFERESEMYPSIPGTSTNSIAQIVNYMTARFTVVDPMINAL